MQPVNLLQSSVLSPSDKEVSRKFEKEISECRTTGIQQFRKVSIFSPDRFIRDFLQGILAFQGYKGIDAMDIQDIFSALTLHADHVVFLDGSSLMGLESRAVRDRVQQLTEAGVHVLVLVDRQGGTDLTAIQNIGGWQRLWKPLDYRQVGQVMAQI